jgi:hypothetical protein
MSSIEALCLFLLRRMGHTGRIEWRRPVAWNTLRIDTNDGSPVVRYRIQFDANDVFPVLEYGIEDAEVKRTTTETTAQMGSAIEGEWHRFTPEQLTLHLRKNAVVAYWLSHRLGAAALKRACTPNRESESNAATELQRHPRRIPGTFGPLQPVTE